MTVPTKPAKCRVNWSEPTRAGTICNYVDEVTNSCYQSDWKRCPCGGIVRHPRFDGLPWSEKERRECSRPVPATKPVHCEHERMCRLYNGKHERYLPCKGIRWDYADERKCECDTRSRPAPQSDAQTIRQQEREWWMLRVKAILQKTKYYDELDDALQELVQEAMDGSQQQAGEKR